MLEGELKEFFDYKNHKKKAKNSGFQEEEFNLFPTSDVLSFSFENALKVMMRPSGTEAKIKFYFSHHEKEVNPSIPLKKRKESRVSATRETVP